MNFPKYCLAAIFLLVPGMAHAEDLSLCKKGWNATELGQYQDAIKLFDSCLATGQLGEDNTRRTYRNKGITYNRMGEFDLAIAQYNLVLDGYLNDTDLVNRGNAYSNKGSYSAALQDFNQALSLAPTNPEIFYNRAVLFERMGNEADARRDYEQAFKFGSRRPVVMDRMRRYASQQYQLTFAIPANFKEIKNHVSAHQTILMFLPNDQEPSNWEEMISIQTLAFTNPNLAMAERFTGDLLNAYTAKCETASIQNFQQGDDYFSATAYCTNSKLAGIPGEIVRKKNSLVFMKTLVRGGKFAFISYEWQSDTETASSQNASDRLETFAKPFFKTAKFIETKG